jgi:hypothetical protein
MTKAELIQFSQKHLIKEQKRITIEICSDKNRHTNCGIESFLFKLNKAHSASGLDYNVLDSVDRLTN